MLPLDNRIRKKKEFDKIFKEGIVSQSDSIIIKILKNDQKKTRFGFIVSKKVSPKATERNKIKRILREQIRIRLPEIKKGFDMVIISKKEALEKNSKEIGREMEKMLVKSKVLK